MEQNFKSQLEMENQEFQQPATDIETPDEIEIRYKQFLQEDMKRKAFIPKYQESKYTIHRAPKNNNNWSLRQVLNFGSIVCGIMMIIIMLVMNYY